MKRPFKIYAGGPHACGSTISDWVFLGSYSTRTRAFEELHKIFETSPAIIIWSMRLTGPGVNEHHFRDDDE